MPVGNIIEFRPVSAKAGIRPSAATSSIVESSMEFLGVLVPEFGVADFNILGLNYLNSLDKYPFKQSPTLLNETLQRRRHTETNFRREAITDSTTSAVTSWFHIRGQTRFARELCPICLHMRA